MAAEVLETDYLVIGAGASAMAFVDEVIAHSDAEVVLIDRRHAPGGHWIDAYPFVRLHQPSAYYGVNSLSLGHDAVQTNGPEPGYYERASGAEIVDYYQRVLDQVLLPSGRVRFMPMTEYRGDRDGGHVIVSMLDGTETVVRVRRRVVDAGYVASQVPARNRRGFETDEGARVVTPGDLVRLDESAAGFTVIGAGKTAMDSCTWLLDAGVPADEITWVRPRDGWFVNRRVTQPFEQSAGMVEYQARLLEAIAEEADGPAMARRLEHHGVFHRLDPDHEPAVFRGATATEAELERLRAITRVVRQGRVRRIGTTQIDLTEGSLPTNPRQVHVDCTAQGLATSPVQPIYQPGRIVMQFTMLGNATWSAATIGYVEALDTTDETRNQLCPPVPRTGLIGDYYDVLRAGLAAENARRADPVLQGWSATARLNAGRSIPAVLADQHAAAMLDLMFTSIEPALTSLERWHRGRSADG